MEDNDQINPQKTGKRIHRLSLILFSVSLIFPAYVENMSDFALPLFFYSEAGGEIMFGLGALLLGRMGFFMILPFFSRLSNLTYFSTFIVSSYRTKYILAVISIFLAPLGLFFTEIPSMKGSSHVVPGLGFFLRYTSMLLVPFALSYYEEFKQVKIDFLNKLSRFKL